MGDYNNFVIDHIVFFLLAIVLPGMSLKRGELKIEEEWDSKVKTIFYLTNSAILWFGAIFLLGLWYFCDRPFSILGFQAPQFNLYTILFSSIFIVVYAYNIIKDFYTKVGLKKVVEKWADKSHFMPSNNREFLSYCILAFSAGVTEEIIFRGYLMNYILALSPSTGYVEVAIAMFIPAIIFGVIHMYQGFEAVQKIVIAGLLFGAIYYYSQSLVLVMLIHFLVDVVSGYYLLKAFSQDEIEGELGS